MLSARKCLPRYLPFLYSQRGSLPEDAPSLSLSQRARPRQPKIRSSSTRFRLFSLELALTGVQQSRSHSGRHHKLPRPTTTPLFVPFPQQAHLPPLLLAPRPPNCLIHALSVQLPLAQSLPLSCRSTLAMAETGLSLGQWLTLHRSLAPVRLLHHPRITVSHLVRLSIQLSCALRANRATRRCKCRCIHITTHGTTLTHPHHLLITLPRSLWHPQRTQLQLVATNGRTARLCPFPTTITATWMSTHRTWTWMMWMKQRRPLAYAPCGLAAPAVAVGTVSRAGGARA